ncbi:MAG: glycosyltransferase [Candidatus Competibacteraceae bacterium]|nr:glycosyltransferase [Candidatus Competibacteraceae bacterium]
MGQYVVKRINFIPDDEVEIFFKSADVLILPYKAIFQSGLQFLAYGFGLPVIATDIGSFREDIIEGKTGMICRSEDADDLADKIHAFFAAICSPICNRLAARLWSMETESIPGRRWATSPALCTNGCSTKLDGIRLTRSFSLEQQKPLKTAYP